jgi:hypothetical protein
MAITISKTGANPNAPAVTREAEEDWFKKPLSPQLFAYHIGLEFRLFGNKSSVAVLTVKSNVWLSARCTRATDITALNITAVADW